MNDDARNHEREDPQPIDVRRNFPQWFFDKEIT
jgi:hypothetical protein